MAKKIEKKQENTKTAVQPDLTKLPSEKFPEMKFSIKSIKFSEVKTLAVLTEAFIRSSGLLEKISGTDWYKGDNNSFIHLLTEIPNSIYANEQATQDFLHIVEFCFGIDIDDTQGIMVLNLIHKTLDFLQEVGILNFFYKATMILANLIKG